MSLRFDHSGMFPFRLMGSQALRPLLAVWVGILPLVGCNRQIVLRVKGDGGTIALQAGGTDAGAGAARDIASEVAPLTATPDAPPQADDGPHDAPQGAAPPDAPVVTNDAATDAPRKVSDAQADASGPFVCTQDSDCKLKGLHCLVPPGQPGRCVECIGNGHCATPGARLCDPILNRCVECVVAADCPSPSGVYPSTCTPVSHRCQTGCEDDLTTACPTTRSYHCVDNLYLCAECQPATAATDCSASPHGSICHPSEFVCVQCLATTCPVGQSCDPVTARCVQCKSSRDCLAPGMPLCDPVTLTCVPVPP